MNAVSTLKDSTVKVQISQTLLNIIKEHQNHISTIPENLYNTLTKVNITFPTDVQILRNNELSNNPVELNVKFVKEVLKGNDETIKENVNLRDLQKVNCCNGGPLSDVSLTLVELQWLNSFLRQLRTQYGKNIYLNDMLESCKMHLPQNEILPRNPELESRCQKLREDQQNQEYFKMTKHVNATMRNHPEDTISYQLKAINSQIIAVLQFILSVMAGFVFGFLGIELIIGNMDFGVRLLLGIMFALIIAVAEIYFLVKKLNEYDKTVDNIKKLSTPKKIHKLHGD